MLDGLSLHVLHDTPTLDQLRAAAIATSIAAVQLGFDPSIAADRRAPRFRTPF